MVSGNGFFRLESDTSRTAAGATLYQWQNKEWVIVDHKAINYLIKPKHEPKSRRLVTLLDRLIRYTFDLKYLEGSKLKVSDTLS